MYLLVATSVVGMGFIIERGMALRWKKIIPPSVEEAAVNCRRKEEIPGLVQTCQSNPSPLSTLLLQAQEHINWPKQENVDSIETRARHEVVQLDRGLVILEIVVGIAPLLGLVGTLHGLITLFGDLGKAGMGDNTQLAKGISIALNTTLMGLIVAIPSLIAWSYYNKKVETLAVEMESICEQFLRNLYRGRH
ncbi:MAG: MotA/TolQ/ExbB proton channel family protein [Verrucomicrobiales bacterium]